MKNSIIIFFVMLALIASTLTFIYYKYERSNNTGNLDYINISVSASSNKKPINIGFRIDRDGFFYKDGETLKEGAVLVKVLRNSSYTITSINLENQSYYTFTKKLNLDSGNTNRVDLNMIPPGELVVNHRIEDEKIFLEVSSIGPYNNLSYCIDWSDNFLWVKSLNYTSSFNIYNSNYVKCYNTNKNLYNDSILIALEYKHWQDLISEDFIKIYFLDKDIVNNKIIYENFGGKDIEYTISNI